ncbi:MAG: membrane protein insertion efficiency factor YidD [Elusimicrobia bacterium RIFOXYC2_FULL_34_12]|nr:MAG: membrane protein insertion efficiency factor YidD [Elusimicrobia bacterium RIFOXYC2_FULL_34_12]OGS38472.1 MAG: membrane protein insertion efficiency factor YidD [Elusimicrobia bacterium RIFOXYD2_FULL_34_30]HAM38675.1 membrane protein insertion efficiency factor YidD [Elusimicrobiota bacterium]
MLKGIAITFIKIYQKVFLFFPHQCRFHPSCSNYAIGVIGKFGFLKGSMFTIRRIMKCGPWHPGGYDPIP